MNTLRDQLPTSIYDTIRQALGLDPLVTAVTEGKKITENIRSNLDQNVE